MKIKWFDASFRISTSPRSCRALSFKLTNALLLSGQRLANAKLAELFGINLGEPASHRRLAQCHVPADLTNPQSLTSDHFNDLQLEARVEDSSF